MLDEQLESMSIFALREFARRVGVTSPTSKKKEQLVKEIIDIREGKAQPNINTSKHGRPPKTNNLNFSEMPKLFQTSQSCNTVLEQPRNIFSFVDVETIGGYVELTQNGAALLWCYKDFAYNWIYIPSELVFTTHILTGDFVVVELGKVDGQQCVTKIYNINDCPLVHYDPKRKNYLDYKHLAPTKKLSFNSPEFSNLGLLKGESVYFYGENNNANTQTIINLLNDVKDVKKLYLNVSVAEKNKGFLEKLERCEMFVSKLTDSVDDCKRMIKLCIERAKRVFEFGDAAVIVIDDVASLFDIDTDKSLTRELMGLTKNSNALGSITLWPIMKNVVAFDKLYDKRFVIENNSIVAK